MIPNLIRRLGGIMKWIVFGLLLAFSLFQLYTAIFGQFTAYIQRSIHLGFGLTVIFFYSLHEEKASKTKIPFYDYIISDHCAMFRDVLDVKL